MGSDRAYRVEFINQSTNLGTVCLYMPGSWAALAWLTQQVAPGEITAFNWTTNYSFVWAETGELLPGVVFNAAQMWSTDLETNNQVTFTQEAGVFTFENQTQTPTGVVIVQTGDVPLLQASVGLGLGEASYCATQAQPNTESLIVGFSQPPRIFRIAFGPFTTGEVLDVENIVNPGEIVFAENVNFMTAILGEDGNWTIT